MQARDEEVFEERFEENLSGFEELVFKDKSCVFERWIIKTCSDVISLKTNEDLCFAVEKKKKA